jgi:hypothetical protein
MADDSFTDELVRIRKEMTGTESRKGCGHLPEAHAPVGPRRWLYHQLGKNAVSWAVTPCGMIIRVTSMKEAPSSSETSVLTRVSHKA